MAEYGVGSDYGKTGCCIVFTDFCWLCLRENGYGQDRGEKAFSDLPLYLIVPAMVINSYLTEFDPKVLQNLLQSFALSTVLLLLGLVITFLLTLRIGKEKNTPILRFACIFSNAAYMGFPLIQALFGADGLLYASAYVTVFNILLWTVCYAMVSGKVRPGEVLHSILTTPVIWSVLLGLTLYLCRVNVPELIRQPLQLVGNMNTPLSMIITGMLIAGSKPEKLLGNREIYRIILIRMLFIPLVSFLLFRLLSVQGMVQPECQPALRGLAVGAVFAGCRGLSGTDFAALHRRWAYSASRCGVF